MSYILLINPAILGAAIHVPNAQPQLLFATAMASAIGSITMGVVARYPFATAPGMGLNAYFAFTVVLKQGIDWRIALGAVFVEGIIFFMLSIGGIRQAILNGIPANLKLATTAGIGMFLALIGMKSCGLVGPDKATYITLGDLHSDAVLVAMFGLLVTAVLMARRVTGAILVGILATTALSILTHAHVYGPPDALGPFTGLPGGSPVQMPLLPRDIFMAMDVRGALGMGALAIVFTFLFVEIFDTAGTLIGLAIKAGYIDENGNLPRANQAFLSDAVATTCGAILGTSTTTAYIESAAGIEEGGRTGLTAVVVGLLFAASVFIWPLAAAIPAAATAPALILVGAMMTFSLSLVQWTDYSETVPVFLTMIAMPFTYSIANGVSFGIISYVAIKLLSGRARQVHPVSYLLAAVLIARYIWLAHD